MSSPSKSVFRESIAKPSAIEPNDKIKNLIINERYDQFVLMESGRVFKARARGSSGSYAPWVEVDIIQDIKSDLYI